MGRKKKGDMSLNKIRISVTISPELDEALVNEAIKRGKNLSSIYQEAVENYIEKNSIKVVKPEVKRRVYVEPTTTHEVPTN